MPTILRILQERIYFLSKASTPLDNLRITIISKLRMQVEFKRPIRSQTSLSDNLHLLELIMPMIISAKK